MKRSNLLMTVCLAVTFELAPAARAQGPLTPPGEPAPTMKTLAQVEPRTPVSSAPITLSQPGSYYLTANLSGTVMIAADNVALDLMGFTIEASSGSAISQSGLCRNVRIHNGVVAAPQGSGVSLGSSVSNANGVVENLQVGPCQGWGIVVGGGFTVRNCQVSGTGVAGIYVAGNSVIRDCRIEGCGMGLNITGKDALVENNVVKGNADNYNIAKGNRINLLLCEIPESISWPCSVKFAGTLTMTGSDNGIVVYSDNVTIDLAGHALVGPGVTSGYGIYHDTSYRNLRVMNGQIVGWCGVGKAGVYAGSPSAILTDLQAQTNYYGIATGDGAVISDCTAQGNANDGFHLSDANTVSDCTASRNGARGISAGSGCVIAGCLADQNVSNGIEVAYSSMVSGCATYYNLGNGFFLSGSCTISKCKAGSNNGDGIRVGNTCEVFQSGCFSNGNNGDGAGIHALSSDNRIEENNLLGNDRGVDIDQAGNWIARNVASGNTLNWDIVAGNVCLVVYATPTSGAISGNSGGTAPGSTDPNANFTY